MHRALTYLAISMGVSFAAAITFVIVLTLTLPQSDGAHGQMPFADPLVFPVMAVGATISGLIGWPLYALFGRHVPSAILVKTTTIPVLVFILLVTPFHARIAWLGSYMVCVMALFFSFLRHQSKPTCSKALH